MSVTEGVPEVEETAETRVDSKSGAETVKMVTPLSRRDV